MAKIKKEFAQENDFFMSGRKRRKIKYNLKCLRCICDCKQSYKACVVICPYYTAKQKGDNNL